MPKGNVDVARRLSRMEALLIEMRHEQDVHLKRITRLQDTLDTLTEQAAINRARIRRVSRRQK
jgi:hypothetical protein